MVICNGGAGTAYQALSEGAPVLGIPTNFDQYLAMTAIEKAGCGILLRSGSLTAEKVRMAVSRILETTAYREAAQRMKIYSAGIMLLTGLAAFLRKPWAKNHTSIFTQ